MRKNDVLRILILVFAVLIAALVIGGGIYLITASKSIKGLTVTPDFPETELGVLSEYSFSVSATPAKASVKKVKCVCDDPSATFELSKDGKATLVTGGSEGVVTVYVEYKDIKSNVLTFQVVDLVARAQQQAAEEAAAAEALAAAEAEAQAAQAAEVPAKMYVKMTGDNVNVRAQNNTDCDILGKAKKGDTFEKVEIVDEWTHIMYNGQDGYIKSEYLTEVSEEEALSGASEPSDTTAQESKPEEKKEENKEEKKDEKSEDEKAKEAEAAAAEAAQKAAEELAAQQQAVLQQQQLAAAAAAAVGTPINCKDGTCYVTAAQLQKIHATWDFAGDAVEMAGHHSIGELEAVIGPTQH